MSKHQTEWTKAQRVAVVRAVLEDGRSIPDVLQQAKTKGFEDGLKMLEPFDMPYSTAAGYVQEARADTHRKALSPDPLRYTVDVIEATLAEELQAACLDRRLPHQAKEAIRLARELKKARSELTKREDDASSNDDVDPDVASLLKAAEEIGHDRELKRALLGPVPSGSSVPVVPS
jgi:hypothetical protein